MSEQIRKLTNSIVLSGTLAELETKNGTCEMTVKGSKQTADYISLKGVIKFGNSEVEERRFESFIKSKKANGEDSKLYPIFCDWASSAIPLTKNKENATKVTFSGSMVANDYINVEEQLVKAHKISMQLLNKKYQGEMAKADIEGYIQSVREENNSNGIPTGRLLMDIVSTDYFNNALVLDKVIIPVELAEPFSNMYAEGQTAIFHIDYIPYIDEVSTSGDGIGVQRSVTEGKSHLDMVLVGADKPYEDDDEKALTPEIIRNLLAERKTKLDQIKEAGYLGNKTPSGNSGNRSGFGGSSVSSKNTTRNKPSTMPIDDDDMPF